MKHKLTLWLIIAIIGSVFAALTLTACDDGDDFTPPETVATPTAIPGAGAVASGTMVSLLTATTGAEIWYTTDGTTPSKGGATSSLFVTANPITVTAPVTTIKAIAVRDGWIDSGILTAVYIIIGTGGCQCATEPCNCGGNCQCSCGKCGTGNTGCKCTTEPCNCGENCNCSCGECGIISHGRLTINDLPTEGSFAVYLFPESTELSTFDHALNAFVAMSYIAVGAPVAIPGSSANEFFLFNWSGTAQIGTFTGDDNFKVLLVEIINIMNPAFRLATVNFSNGVGTAEYEAFVEIINCEHIYGGWTETRAPTCTMPAIETETCIECGALGFRTQAGRDALGHTKGEWRIITVPDVNGYEALDCVDCEDIIETRPAPPTEGLAYTEVNGGFAVSRGTANAAIVIIPSEHNGQPVTQIAENGFRWHDLTNVFIPYGVTTIGADAFNSCTGLTSIVIPNSVETIGDNAFAWCQGLTSITIPYRVTTIGESVFRGCSGLTSITIPASVNSIGNHAFRDTGLTSFFVNEYNQSYASQDGILYNRAKTELIQPIFNISGSFTIPNNVITIGDWAFWGCTGLTEIILPDNVITIGDFAFLGCTSLTSVTIGNGVTTIGEHAFADSGLTSIVIPDSVITIGEWAFWRCTSLTSVTIGNGVTTIGDRAFQGCTGLGIVTFLRETPPNLGSWTFFTDGPSAIITIIETLRIKVPKDSVEAYKAGTGTTFPILWTALADRIFAIGE